MMEVKQTYMGKALGKIKNNKYVTTGIATVAVCTALLFARCPQHEGPMKCEEGPNPAVRADGICNASKEAYPFLLDVRGEVQVDKDGKPIPNKCYSKEDCHDTDGVCDLDPKNLKTQAGDPYTVVETDAYGQKYSFKKESADPSDPNFSWDCIKSLCCDYESDPNCKAIEGNFKLPEKKAYLGLLPFVKEGEGPAASYRLYNTSSESGRFDVQREKDGNLDTTPVQSAFWRVYETEPRCNSKKELNICSPLTEGPCICKNHPACKPGPKKVRKPPEKPEPGGETVSNVVTPPSPPSAPTTIPNCPPSMVSGAASLQSDAESVVVDNAPDLRGKHGAVPGDRVTLSASAIVNSSGKITSVSLSSSCSGQCSAAKSLPHGQVDTIVKGLGLKGESMDVDAAFFQDNEECKWKLRPIGVVSE